MGNGFHKSRQFNLLNDGAVKKSVFQDLIMEINWVILGWLIDMILNGFVWLIIAVFSVLIIDMTDTWTRKAIK